MSPVDAVLGRLRTASSLTIVCHDDPDPDALSAAIALELLARESGVETVDILYSGTIAHQQNRAFVDLFDVELEHYSQDRFETNDLVAFVDHSYPGRNNSVPRETDLDLVFDHHPPDRPIPADVVDVREEYGTTATILAEYFRRSRIEITPRIASALLFGIHRERLDFYNRPTDLEYEIGTYLHGRADSDLLRELYGASFLPSSVDAFANVLHNRVRRGPCLVSCIGRLENRVALAQAADFLLVIDGIETVLVCGIVRDQVFLSARTIRTDLDLSDLLERLFGDVGSAGGHEDMAGGQLPLAVIDDGATTDVELVASMRRYVEDRFFGALEHSTGKIDA
ncbi:DHH family phosphoesterase [Natronobacterium texcoconense]|uniref:DHHA1 domain-containing protein n=1 Tax=Natronobacterium texcoconense TaxID=1095778 RepID=A0A1H1FX13_NATTX|nr:bifunctional oligoribonuclease/PAP phosphatase NrnA [Natronobacterium texcoconense]SDR05471.1 DHHA1 domain-containing protein [Natronobacterium texcoconense]